MIKTDSFELAEYAKGDVNAKRLALVLPGRLDTKDYANMKSHVNFLASKGFYALSFDPPGTWESKGDISIYSMTNYLKAVDELIKYYGNRPTVLVGHSRGATIAMIASTRNSFITHLIAIMGNYAPSKIAPTKVLENGYINEVRDDPKPPYTDVTFKLPLNFFEDAKQYNALDSLSGLEKPKLFIYGEKDITVPKEYVITAYKAAAEPKEMYGVNFAHDYRHSPDQIEKVNEVIGEFLDSYQD